MTVNHIWKKYKTDKLYQKAYKTVYSRKKMDRDTWVKNKGYYCENYSFNENSGKFQGINSSYYNEDKLTDGLDKANLVIYSIQNEEKEVKKISAYKEWEHLSGAELQGFYYVTEERIYAELLSEKKSTYIGEVKATERNAYPDNNYQGDYWYEYVGIDNQAPTISGDNNDLGNKTDDFTVDYVITDSDNDTCTVDILADGVKKVSSKAVTLGYKYSYDVKINDFNIGSHKIEIIAKDSKGSTSDTRRYTFYKPNIAPVISGEDADLGGKSSAFVVDYNVTDKNNDSVNVNVLLDDLEIASVSSAQNQELQLKVTDEMLNNFEIGSNHTITIKADDLKGGISYRRYTFTKTNKPPVISGSDQNLGNKTEPFNVSWSITDLEKNPITFKVYLDDNLVMQEDEVVDNKTYSYSIPHEEWIKLDYSTHEIRVVAIDSINFNIPVTRKFKFERVTNGLDIEIKINEFNSKPKKIIVVPHGVIAEDATMHVYACNNYLDSNPTWEDMTTESKVARAHSFTNGSKTNTKWAIGVKLTVENGTSGLGSVIRGFKGGYE